ncbi:protein kinase domain-containing protein [Pendulispora albinea]|uniref:Protein kinase n=1 Tax=Pendulispora albinea TaxID=2741071 RepID=A0ABZ2LS61_9BACT
MAEQPMVERPSKAPVSSGFSAAAPSDGAMAVPRVFGRLLLMKLLARGGMGDVYLAATTGIEGAERPCVVKTVRRDHIHDGSFLARFLDEARVQSQLNHPGVAQVLEASTDESGEPYTLVEYVEGRSLADVRQRAIQLGARIGWPEALAMAIEMAHALAHVHERAGSDGTPLGIVHRDLSPQNVMIGYAGEVKLIDFGTARGHNRRCHTVAGVVFAKPGYVAPEVARQQVGDGRIDVYALGIMLWELCAGRRFLTQDPQKHLEDAAANKVVVPKIAEEIGAPAELDDVIAKLTANDPDDRYASAGFAAHDLGKILSMAPAAKLGERGVRARVQALMKVLWPSEPARSRAEFAKLLKGARSMQKETTTPAAGVVAEQVRAHMNDDASSLPGTPYRLVRKIGEGSSGTVFEAEHVELGRKLAIKVLAAEHASSKDAIERSRREARAVAALSHPNLCLLYDFGRALDGRVFLAMELLEGETLERRLSRMRGMDWREAVELAIEVTRALEAAHTANLVHRDLKPANLFLLDTPTANTERTGLTPVHASPRTERQAARLKLLDFGVAMALSDVDAHDEKRSQGFAIFGTPEYMSPEQVAGDPIDGRCDLYALGCVLYELVTGSAPFEGRSSVLVMGKQLREVPEPPRVRAPHRGIPEALENVIMTALAKSADNRFANAAAMREALEASLVVPAPRRNVRRIASRALAAVAFAAVAIVGGRALTESRLVPSPYAEVAPISLGASGASGASVTPGAALPANAKVPAALAASDPRASTAPVPVPPAAAVVAAKDDVPETDSRRTLDRTPDRRLLEARAYAKTHMGDASALKAWATAAMRAGDLRDARRAAEAWALRDGTAEPRIFLATVLDGTGHRADALAVLEEVLENHPDSVEARRLHARFGVPLGPDGNSSRTSIARR